MEARADSALTSLAVDEAERMRLPQKPTREDADLGRSTEAGRNLSALGEARGIPQQPPENPPDEWIDRASPATRVGSKPSSCGCSTAG